MDWKYVSKKDKGEILEGGVILYKFILKEIKI